MKSRERWNKKLPSIKRLTKAQVELTIRLINLNRQLRNLDKFGPIAKSVSDPGEAWMKNQRQMQQIRIDMGKTVDSLFFY